MWTGTVFFIIEELFFSNSLFSHKWWLSNLPAVNTALCLTGNEVSVSALSKEYIGMMEYKREDEERIVQNLILGILVTFGILLVFSDIQHRAQHCSENYEMPYFIFVQSWLYLSSHQHNLEMLRCFFSYWQSFQIQSDLSLTVHNSDSNVFLTLCSLIKL